MLQNDIDSLEREKLTLTKALEEYKKTKGRIFVSMLYTVHC